MKKLLLLSLLFSAGLCIADSSLVLDTIIVSPINCEGTNTATVILIPAGGQQPYSYEMVGNQNHDPTSNEFRNIAPAGVYTFRVRDAAGQTTELTAMLSPTGLENVSLTISYPCSGDTNGDIIVSVAGNTPPLVVTIRRPDGSDEQQMEDGSPALFQFGDNTIGAGHYTLSVEDSDPECQPLVLEFDIPEYDPIEFTSVTTTPQTSFSGGTITVETSGGAGTILYQLDDGQATAVNTFTDLEAGEYTITAGQSIGEGELDCEAQTEVTVCLAPGNETYGFILKKYCKITC